MASAAVASVLRPTAPPSDRIARRPTKVLPQSLIEGFRVAEKQSFDFNRHMYHIPPERIYTMEELALAGRGTSNTAVSTPFPLFTEEAIRQMRSEIFSDSVLEKHQYRSSFASNQVRGHCLQDAAFVPDAWNNPQVLDILSKIAGIDLVPCWPYDTGHVNVSVNPNTNDVQVFLEARSANEKKVSAFGWHYDSVPFVCVTMLSDCTNMVSGETTMRTGTGEHMKVRGPSYGMLPHTKHSLNFQSPVLTAQQSLCKARYIEHQALKAFRAGMERISMVTSLRPQSAPAKDESVLIGVRGISQVPELYYQYAEYSLQAMQERIREQFKVLRERHDARRDFDTNNARQWLGAQKGYIDSMLEELFEVN